MDLLYKYTIMKTNKYHEQSVELIWKKLVEEGKDVRKAYSPAYDLLVDGHKCKVMAHKNVIDWTSKRYSVVIPIATDSSDMVNEEWDIILYRNIDNNGDPDRFYWAPKMNVWEQISAKMDDPNNIHYNKMRKQKELSNTGCIVNITELAFARIKGVEIYNI